MTCCTDSCCGPGSYCCANTMDHTHDDEGNFVPSPTPDFSPAPDRRLDLTTPKGEYLRGELSRVFNANGIDTELGMPDWIIACMVIEMLAAKAKADQQTASWKEF